MGDVAPFAGIAARPGDLLYRSAETLLQMIEISRDCEEDKETRVFYSHLQLHCIRIRNATGDALHDREYLDGALVDQILEQLVLLISNHCVQNGANVDEGVRDFCLGSLNMHWGEAWKQHDERRLAFVKHWLKSGQTPTERFELSSSLETYADILEKQYSRSFHKEARETFFTTIESSEPSRAVWRTAQSLFDALIGCKGCPCHKHCAFEAKLELGTYRKPEHQEPAEPPRRPHRTRAFKGVIGRKSSEGLDLDLFVSMEREWHEIRVQAIKERGVRFAQGGEDAASDQKNSTTYGREKVERLCKQIIKARYQRLQRLLLRLARGQLFEMRFEKSDFGVDETVEPVSLSQSFEERPGLFTGKTKRILSLILGYTVLHLHGTSWLQWGLVASDIKFFRTKSRKTPLRPFLQVQLSTHDQQFPGREGGVSEDSGEQRKEWTTDDEDLDMGHRCISLVDLAVILLELHFVRPFRELAKARDIEAVPRPRDRVYYIDVDQVFNGRENEDGSIVSEGWRTHIPDDSALLEAIDNCLDVELWEDEESEPLNSEVLKSRIYEKVVRPLELYLTLGFREIPLDNVDLYAKTLDFGRWGQALEHQPSSSVGPIAVRNIQDPKIETRAVYSAVLGGIGALHPEHSEPVYKPTHFLQVQPPRSDTRVASAPSSNACYSVSQFYDDEYVDSASVDSETSKYLVWKLEYEKVYETFVRSYMPGSGSRRVKVAVLDTGIDRDHYAFEAREDRIKGKHNSHNERQRNIPDRHGHGTFVAGLVLDYCPDVDLYIVKITDRENAAPDAETVVKAINHAVNVWNVDIISMSFGWPSSEFDGSSDLQAAIDHAFSKQILMFAAASNNGGRLGRAYPASCAEVICVHSTDTYANISKFSPTAKFHSISIATVGEAIQSSWPTLLCDNEEQEDSPFLKSKSGTSYATAIIAGIAAFLLQYARLHLPEVAAASLKRREKMEALLKRCAERGPDYRPRNDYHYVELSLHKHNLFGQDLEGVNHEIMKALKS